MHQVATEQEASGRAGRARKSMMASTSMRLDAAPGGEAHGDGSTPPWLSSMTVAAAAHEALFRAGPKLIVAESDAAHWRGLTLPKWLRVFVFSMAEGVGRLSTLSRADTESNALALAVPPTDCLGLVAFGKEAAAALTSCAAWLTEAGAGTTPPVKLLAARSEADRRIAVLDFLLARLHGEQGAILQRNAAMHRSLSELRESHEAAQSVLFMVSDTLARHQLPAIECALTLRPGGATVQPDADGRQGRSGQGTGPGLAGQGLVGQGRSIRQRLPLSSQGLAAVALHVTMGARHGKGRLLVRLTAVESGSQLISWAIPFSHLRPGWNFLEIPTVVAGPRQTVELEARWDGELRGAPQLSLSSQFIGSDGCPEIEGGARLRNPLAMQIWTGLPGSRRVSSAFADPADLQRAVIAGRQLLLSPATLGQARLVGPQDSVAFDVLSFRDDNRVLQLHPVLGRIAHAVIPGAVPAGTRRVIAAMRTDNPEGPWVEYAMMLTPAGATATFPTAERPSAAPALVTEWQSLPPGTPGNLILGLEEPTAAIGDLHIATRLPPAMGDSYAWAQWKSVMIELG